ncbi:MAG: helix-turn-helix transcriptional regulator [Saprospiraceae bacterium]|nr:helix-turn-helix transcriptional regulator [Saprospiraceae bacterium]
MRKGIYQIYDYFARALGARPGLMLFLLMVWGIAYLFGTYRMLLYSSGIHLYGWDAFQATLFMSCIVLLLLGILCWRIFTAQAAVDKAVLSDFKNAVGRLPNEMESRILQKQRMPTSFLARLLFIISSSPHSILFLTAALLTASVILKVSYDFWSDAPPKSVQRILFVNMPYIVALTMATVLIFNDIQVLDRLREIFRLDVQISGQQRGLLLAAFQASLTSMENQCLQLKYSTVLRNKEIADQLNISESTVKTHINNINRKWEQFAMAEGIQMPVKTLFQ